MPNEALERMRLLALELEMYGDSGVGTGNGVFAVRRKGVVLRMISSDGDGWEHVSVSTEKRCPTWEEMDWVKGIFWGDEEAVMQLHPPRSEWVNNHPYCLHLWRPICAPIPLPPSKFVGDKSRGVITSESEAIKVLRAYNASAS